MRPVRWAIRSQRFECHGLDTLTHLSKAVDCPGLPARPCGLVLVALVGQATPHSSVTVQVDYVVRGKVGSDMSFSGDFGLADCHFGVFLVASELGRKE